MKTVRFVASILYTLSKAGGILLMVTAAYATLVLALFQWGQPSWLPVEVIQDHFRIFFPFTRATFLLGDYTLSFLITNISTLIFYGIFLLLLSEVFHAFKQSRLFTQSGVASLSRFYMTNLAAPVLFLVLLLFFGVEKGDILRITLLHIIIGVFAFFMAAIFKQGLLLQEEQDLTF